MVSPVFRTLCFVLVAGAVEARGQVLDVVGPPSADLVSARAVTAPQVLDLDLRAAVPLSREWGLAARVSDFVVREPTVLSDGARVPEHLWNLSAGVSWAHQFGERRVLTLRLGVGSASDQPFHGIEETEISATALWMEPSGATGQWLFGLNFSNNRPFANYVPLPIVAYLFRSPELRLDGAVGFPFAAINWRPTPIFDVGVAAIGPTVINAEAGLRAADPVRLFAAFNWGQTLWAQAGRGDRATRLIYDSVRASGGADVRLFDRLRVRLAAGYAFANRIFSGQSEFSGGPEAALPSGFFASASIGFALAPPGPR